MGVKVLQDYLHTIEKKFAIGDATEHTHRSALETMVESMAEGITATNEPRHIDCGAPDFILRKGSVTVGYIEAKDIGKSLDEAEKSEQLNRYRNSLTNLILTDYLEFRWYVDAQCRLKARLGSPDQDGKIRPDRDGIQNVADLLTGFLSHKAERVGTPRELARRMARQSHLIRNLIINAFTSEPKAGGLHAQLAAFRDNLIPDLSIGYFADMYAQTIAYGLFAARCTHPEEKNFTRQNAAYLLPKTNPFLRKLFNTIAGPDLDDRIAWLVDDLAELLAQADMKAILKDFGKHIGKEDPVVHFYETFLKEYDEKIREMRGVYYTPEPVVSYIVRSIDHLLKTRFNRPRGLADENTFILDPATGTATFLYMIINEIRQAFAGQEGMWSDYVSEKLLPRLFGFELLMAPYAVAHLKLGILLEKTGYKSESDQRLGIYLTNTLDEALKHAETLFGRWITEEANAAAEIKKEKPIMVVLGNPPYSGISANMSEIEVTIQPGQTYIDHLELQIVQRANGEKMVHWSPVEVEATSQTKKHVKTFIGRLIEDYKIVDGQLLNERKHWLQDDYVKFIRFGQWRIERTGQGVLGFITNNGYLDNPTFRGMRQSLMDTFSDIYILNLHGNAKKREIAPDGGKDENVFDIQQGVAIGIFVREANRNGTKVQYADVWGTRDAKYETLFETDLKTVSWVEVRPHKPDYLFVPQEDKGRNEWEEAWKLTDVFSTRSVGIVTARDGLTIRWSSKEIEHVLRDLIELSEAEARDKYRLGDDARDWKVASAQKDIKKSGLHSELITPILYRPFDSRFTYYTGQSRGFIGQPQQRIMRHMLLHQNISLICPRRVETSGHWQHIHCAASIVDHVAVSLKTVDSVFPLYLYPAEGEMQFDSGRRRPNLNPEFITAVSERLGSRFVEDGRGDLEQTFGPEDIFNYAYAVFHSPAYRTRYVEFLKTEFPRLPLASDKSLFKVLVQKGDELVCLHLMKSPVLANLITRYPVVGSNEVDKVNYDENNRRVNINETQCFEGVPPEVWNFLIGGYQVCQKWLKDRKGRTLTYDERTHYQKVIVALKETIRLMAEIDELIPGWPIVTCPH